MTDFWQAAAGWAGHAGAAGGGVLLLGWVFGRLTAEPARRQRAAAWAIRGAVLAAVLCLFPSWLRVPVPQWGDAESERLAATRSGALHADAPLTVPVSLNLTDDTAASVPPPEWNVDLATAIPETESPLQADAPLRVAANRPMFDSGTVVPALLAAYAAVGLFLLAQLAAGHAALWRLRRSARPAPARAQAVFDSLIPVGMRKPALLASDRVEAPVCFGLARPTVVLPRELAAEAGEDELRWVLAHELDHLHRGDPATAAWAGVARGLYFGVPWFWAVRRDLALTQEYLADAAAAAADGRAVDYAAFLVDLSDDSQSRRGADTRGTLMAAHAVRAGRSDLFRRVNMLLKSGIDRRCPKGWTVVAAGGLLSAAVMFSGLGWAADDADDADQPAKIEKKIVVRVEDGPPPPDAPPTPPVPGNPDKVRQLKRDIEAALKDGKADEVRDLVKQLEKALTAAPRPDARPDPRPGRRNPDALIAPPNAPQPPAPPADLQLELKFEDVQRMAMEQAARALEAQLKQFKDRPEVQEQMAKALEQLRAAEGEMQRARGMLQQLGQFDIDNLDSKIQDQKKLVERIVQDKAESIARARKELAEQAKDLAEKQKKMAEEHQKNFNQNWQFDQFKAPGFAFAPPNAPQGEAFFRPGPVRFGAAVGRLPEALAEQLDLGKDNGLLVLNVQKNSPADKAGLKKNDIVIRFAGKDVAAEERKFVETVAAAKPGEKVEVVVLRKGKKEALTAELPEPPKSPVPPKPPARKAPVEIELRGGKVAFSTMMANVDDDKFSLQAVKGGTKYAVTGKLEDGRPTPEKIIVTDGDEKKEYKNAKDVPEEHRAAIRQLLSSIGGR